MMNILITSAGQRVSLVRAFKTELRKEYPDGKVYAVDMVPELSPACNVADGYIKVQRVTHPEYISNLIGICKSYNISMVVPTIDTELLTLATNKQLFADNGIHVIISSVDFVSICRDKRKTNTFFKENNIKIPEPVDKENPVFPLFIKPYDGSLSVDTFLVKTAADLTDYHRSNEKLLFMEYIDPANHNEFTLDMYYGRDSYLKCIVPRKRIAVRAGEISKGLTCKNVIVSYVKERLNFIPGAVGCLTMQVFLNKENNNIVGIEINPRFGGGYPLSYAAGAKYPAYLIKEYFKNEPVVYNEDWEDKLLMLRYDDEILVHGYNS